LLLLLLFLAAFRSGEDDVDGTVMAPPVPRRDARRARWTANACTLGGRLTALLLLLLFLDDDKMSPRFRALWIVCLQLRT
jgi:hypothetical protein